VLICSKLQLKDLDDVLTYLDHLNIINIADLYYRLTLLRFPEVISAVLKIGFHKFTYLRIYRDMLSYGSGVFSSSFTKLIDEYSKSGYIGSDAIVTLYLYIKYNSVYTNIVNTKNLGAYLADIVRDIILISMNQSLSIVHDELNKTPTADALYSLLWNTARDSYYHLIFYYIMTLKLSTMQNYDANLPLQILEIYYDRHVKGFGMFKNMAKAFLDKIKDENIELYTELINIEQGTPDKW
jgi:hypothetical protein